MNPAFYHHPQQPDRKPDFDPEMLSRIAAGDEEAFIQPILLVEVFQNISKPDHRFQCPTWNGGNGR